MWRPAPVSTWWRPRGRRRSTCGRCSTSWRLGCWTSPAHRPDGSSPLAAVTTESLEAYRAYLLGLEHLNHWELAARRKRRSGGRSRSTAPSASAYFKLGQARGWMPGRGGQRGAERRAPGLPVCRTTAGAGARDDRRLSRHARRRVRALPAALPRAAGPPTRSTPTPGTAWGTRSSTIGGGQYRRWHDPLAAGIPPIADAGSPVRPGVRAHHLPAQQRERPERLLRAGGAGFLRRDDGEGEAAPRQPDPGRRGAPGPGRRGRKPPAAGSRLQPATARARHALFEAYFASEDWGNASREVAELARLLPPQGRDLAAYLEARVRFARGDPALGRGAGEEHHRGLRRTGAGPARFRPGVRFRRDGGRQSARLRRAISTARPKSSRWATRFAAPPRWPRHRPRSGSRTKSGSGPGWPSSTAPRADPHGTSAGSGATSRTRRGGAPAAERAASPGPGPPPPSDCCSAADPDSRPLAELETLTGRRRRPGGPRPRRAGPGRQRR